MKASTSDPNVLRLAADIVAAHVRHNDVAAGALPDLIRTVYAALSCAHTQAEIAERPISCRAGAETRLSRLHRLYGGRQAADDAQASPSECPWHDTRRIQGRVGVASELSDGCDQPRAQRSKMARAAGLGRKKMQPASGVVKVSVQKVASGVSGNTKSDREKAAPILDDAFAN
jgi:predicted transcriptional regulator